MVKKIKLLLVFISLSVTLGLMSSTYSRYVASSVGDVKIDFAKWQIKVNTNDITDSTSSSINIVPTMMSNDNVKSNTIAPSSSGYFDIVVDGTNVDVSYNYSITLSLVNQNIPDLLISKYAILSSTYNSNDEITMNNITNSTISGSNNYDSTDRTFTIRVFFEWYEGTNESMDDDADTLVSVDANTNNTQLEIQATMSFEQKL